MPQGSHNPELKKYMDKRLSVKLNGKRQVVGVLRGYDPFMNITLDQAIEELPGNVQNELGIVIVRGNSIETIECLDPIDFSKK